MSVTFNMYPNPWDRLPALAERLGVKPIKKPDGIVIIVDDQMYSVFDLLNAFLDIVDTHTPPTAQIIPFRKKQTEEE